jgi:trigger factor
VEIMKNIEKASLKKKFKIKVPYSKIEKKMEEDFLKLSKNLKISGFRPGKVPISFVKSRYEKDVKSKITEKLIQEEGNKEFENKGYRLAAQPKVKLISNIEDKVDLEAEYEFEVLPEIILKKLDELKLTKYVSKIEDKDVNKVIDNLFNEYKEYKEIEKNRNAKIGDRLIISYKGYLDNKPFDGGTGEKQTIDLGNNNFFPEFEKNLIGKSKEEKIKFHITFPKDYNIEKLKGKKVKFDLIINNILEGEKLKDEKALAEKTGSKTPNDLRNKIKNELKKYSEDLSFNVLKRTIVKELNGLYTFDLPEILVLREVETLKNQNKANNKESKIEVKELEKNIRKEAENKVKIGLIISEIGIKNKINVTEKEIETALARICMQYPGKEKEVIEHYKNNPSYMNALKGPIFEDKVMKYIEENAKINEKIINSEEMLNKASSVNDNQNNKKKGENE